MQEQLPTKKRCKFNKVIRSTIAALTMFSKDCFSLFSIEMEFMDHKWINYEISWLSRVFRHVIPLRLNLTPFQLILHQRGMTLSNIPMLVLKNHKSWHEEKCVNRTSKSTCHARNESKLQRLEKPKFIIIHIADATTMICKSTTVILWNRTRNCLL